MKKCSLNLLGIILYFYLVLFASQVMASADYSIVKITSYSESNGVYLIGIEGQENNNQVFGGCKILSIRVNYQRVPWYSWLPFVHTSHPTSEDTVEALKYIHETFINQKEIYFGVAGDGLVETGSKCVFDSKGLKQSTRFVFSYYHPF